MSKADDLEKYIKKASTQVPSNLFDLHEWSDVLNIAREVRNVESVAVHAEVMSLKQNSALLQFLAQNPVQTTKAEIKLLKQEATAALSIMQTDLANGKSLINFLVCKLRDICTPANVEKLQQENRNLRTTYGNEYDKMQAFVDALVLKHKEELHSRAEAIEASHEEEKRSLRDRLRDAATEASKKKAGDAKMAAELATRSETVLDLEFQLEKMAEELAARSETALELEFQLQAQKITHAAHMASVDSRHHAEMSKQAAEMDAKAKAGNL